MQHVRSASRAAFAALAITLAAHAQSLEPQSLAPQSIGGGAPSLLLAPTCSGATLASSTFNGVGGPIFGSSFATYTCTVSGLGSYLWDIDLTTAITHTACFDLDLQLISPSGKTVTITTDNGGVNDNVFNGTLWDDNVNTLVTDYTFTNLTTATPLSPEGRLSAFRGENPNGVWTLRVADDTQGNVGSLNSWSLAVSALASAPSANSTTFTRTPNIAILSPGSISDAVNVAGVGAYLAKLELYVELPHTAPTDLDFYLTSPAGTVVYASTRNGGSFDNVFNGTLWNPSSTLAPTDNLYANGVVVPELSPEGSFDNFLGQNPNGSWQLFVTDFAAPDVGALVRWELRVTTIANPGSPAKTNFAGATGAIPDAGFAPPTIFTTNVSGMSGVLWDVELFTAISHGLNADLDITLTSPAGTTISITSDNGFTSNVFTGTTWDDNVNAPVSDYVFSSGVNAPQVAPEGRLGAFRGESPNGVWTLSVTDDLPFVAGTLNSWSLTATTIPALPPTNSVTFSRTPNAPVLDLLTVTDVINVTGVSGSIERIKVYVEVPHTWSNDLDLVLTSPAGTSVALSTDNAGELDDVFNGTLFDIDAPFAATDHVYVDLLPATPLSPEGPFDVLIGQGANGAWTLSVTDDFSPDTGVLVRWDLTIETCALAQPVRYCTPLGSGSSSGCVPTISANANPSLSFAGPCSIAVANVEGQKTGIVFYGVSGATNLLWCAGGNSFFCVKTPTQRTFAASSGGVAGQCNGALALDWNAYQAANPIALGNPWTLGSKAYVQSWFRDPPSCKTTFLSEAIELTYVP